MEEAHNPPPNPPKFSYAKVIQQPAAALFQHDPVRAAKKTFQDNTMRRIGSDSSFKGEPGIIYSFEETAELAALLKFALASKFSHGFPNLNFLRIRIVKLGLKGNVTVERLNFKHVLIRLSNEEDFSRIWLRGEWTFDSFHMRVFKWTPNFDPQIESSIAPVWIRLPALPVHLFEKNALFTVASKIRKPLRMDEPTADLSRPDLARVCVEIDVTSPKVQTVHLQIEGKTYRQQDVNTNPNDTASPSANVGQNAENNLKVDDIMHANDIVITVHDILDTNDVFSLPSHVPEPGLQKFQQNNGTGHVAEASLEDFNYEDPLIAALLDRDWDTDKTCRKEQQHIHIENVSHFRKWAQGENSKQRNREDQAQEQSSPAFQTASLESEGEQEPTPISNRFQSLEDMEMEDTLQHIENIQTTSTPIVGKEVEQGEDGGQSYIVQSIATPRSKEGEATQQAIIFKDSITSNKHKRNKSLEGITEKSMIIGGKGALQEDILCIFVYANLHAVLLFSCKTASIPWKRKCHCVEEGKEGVSQHQYVDRAVTQFCPYRFVGTDDSSVVDLGHTGLSQPTPLFIYNFVRE
ncbi:hypothetical protein Sango_2748100 [Sesamum angolense]|uniref:DUF4283 domain-containing protein n=1 Tax=Sesamum angolense TaxID=2727404 RepID=A0AAE1T8R7_9LAMI|nr:hypothetical protein Sango_2748100 [Sesamum angolense]